MIFLIHACMKNLHRFNKRVYTAWNAVAVMFPGARPFCRLTGCQDDRMLIWNSSYSFELGS